MLARPQRVPFWLVIAQRACQTKSLSPSLQGGFPPSFACRPLVAQAHHLLDRARVQAPAVVVTLVPQTARALRQVGLLHRAAVLQGAAVGLYQTARVVTSLLRVVCREKVL